MTAASTADLLPRDERAERTILGALILDGDRLPEVSERIQPRDFCLESHQRIFQAMLALGQARQHIDAVTLPDQIAKTKGGVKACGGSAYLAGLTEGVPRQAHIAEYVRILKERTQERDLLKLAESVKARVDNHGEPVAKISRWAADQFTALTADAATGSGAGRWAGEGMETFLADADDEIGFLIPGVLAPESLTQIYAPRGLGKSVLADCWAVILAASGKRVMILDRDNPRRTLQIRLLALGANDLGDLRINLKAISREKCPPLTKPEAWAEFPYADYDLVIVDSLDAMAEGVGEQDSSKPARAMAPLLDICHREGGPAVLLLGNTIKSGAHSRGCGVNEDRADIVFELRDGTGFHPTGSKPWIEELPAQGASEWASRSSRRKGRTTFRLAMVATKFRLGEEPAPSMWEISLADLPWTVTDVTASIDAAGEAARLRVIEEKAARIAKGVAMLVNEIDSRSTNGEPAIQKTAAEAFLMKAGYTKKDARDIIADGCIVAISVPGKGHPVELHRHGKDATAEMRESLNPKKDADSAQADFRHPHQVHTAEINPSQTCINKGDSQSAISAAEPGNAPDEGLFLDVEV